MSGDVRNRTLGVSLPPAIFDRVKAEAHIRDLTASHLVTRALEMYLPTLMPVGHAPLTRREQVGR